MTLGRLVELYQAEQQGKQIMIREFGPRESYERIKEIKLSDCELCVLVAFFDETITDRYSFFIKGEEDKYGNKL